MELRIKAPAGTKEVCCEGPCSSKPDEYGVLCIWVPLDAPRPHYCQRCIPMIQLQAASGRTISYRELKGIDQDGPFMGLEVLRPVYEWADTGEAVTP